MSRIFCLFGSKVKNMRYNWQHKDWANFSYNRDATATRDLQHLSGIGALSAQGDGRSTHYELTV
jgi:hypothetical protein